MHGNTSVFDRDIPEQEDKRDAGKADHRQELKRVNIRQRCSLLLQYVVGELLALRTASATPSCAASCAFSRPGIAENRIQGRKVSYEDVLRLLRLARHEGLQQRNAEAPQDCA